MEILELFFGWLLDGFGEDDPEGRAELDPDG